MSSVFVDVRLAQMPGVPERVSTVFGDVRVDLRQLATSAETVHLQVGTVFGDVEVLVARASTRRSRAGRCSTIGRPSWHRSRGWRARRGSSSGRGRSSATSSCAVSPGEDPRRWRAVLDRFNVPRPPPR
ncbi:hypothetical protein [Modestobacter sp. DSM 44400]|uniref:hypothetical protein n=1 Tax=Modestobacter sp. DSM 44400 TaxID=1550230 RepID=UPI001115417C|nr:hypothetical protein [Modestobacter sp. DSM 44400]